MAGFWRPFSPPVFDCWNRSPSTRNLRSKRDFEAKCVNFDFTPYKSRTTSVQFLHPLRSAYLAQKPCPLSDQDRRKNGAALPASTFRNQTLIVGQFSFRYPHYGRKKSRAHQQVYAKWVCFPYRLRNVSNRTGVRHRDQTIESKWWNLFPQIVPKIPFVGSLCVIHAANFCGLFWFYLTFFRPGNPISGYVPSPKKNRP